MLNLFAIEEKTVHMQRIKEWSGYEFSDMVQQFTCIAVMPG